MDTTQQGVILLMKSAITGEGCELPQDFDLDKACDLMKHHTVLALGYVGACKCGLDKHLPGMQKLYKAYCLSALLSERQLQAADRIFEAFEKNGIDFMPVKGCNLKYLYPAPGLRSMGDADILVHMEQYDTICSIMQELGYEEGVHEDHCNVWKSKDLEVELHRYLVPSTDADYYAYYRDSWRLASRSEGRHWYMTVEDQYVYILTHFAKHYRGAGIGLSHVLDLWICLRSDPEMNRTYVERELNKLGLLEFHQNIERLLDAWFGEGKLDDKLEFMAQYIFRNGVWGSLENQTVSAGLQKSTAAQSRGKMRLEFWFRAFFPTLHRMQNYYPVLRKVPILLPFVWVWRWLTILFVRRQSITERAQKAKNISDDKLADREKALAYMGLHFETKE